MITHEAAGTEQKQPSSRSSSLPKILHKIAYSERVGRFCSWLYTPISDCYKNERLRSWFKKAPLESEDPLVTGTKVHKSTSTRVGRVKKSLAIISIGFLLLCNLPQAGAFVNNLKNFAQPTVCLENDTMKRCYTIEDNMHVSCCVTDKILGIEVCKDYLITMPETASIPFRDLSRMKDQCSADLTDETREIRQDINIHVLPKGIDFRGIKNFCFFNCGDTVIQLPTKSITFLTFVEKLQKSLDAIGYPRDVPLSIKFLRPDNPTDILILDAGMEIDYIGSHVAERCSSIPVSISLSHTYFEYLSIEEIFSSINHELGHVVFKLRKFAQFPPFYKRQSSQRNNFEKYAEETFADLVSNLLSEPNTNQIMFLRRHVALQEPNSRFQPEKDSMSCIPDGTRSYPPYVCRVAFADNIQNQLED